jgi:hypothetical protein
MKVATTGADAERGTRTTMQSEARAMRRSRVIGLSDEEKR